MDSFDTGTWDLFDYSFIDDVTSSDFRWVNQSSSIEIDFSQNGTGPADQDFSERELKRKRGLHSCSKIVTKACREKLRREKLNDSFVDLSAVLDLGRAAKTDKLAILAEAIRSLNELRGAAKHLKVENEKLQDEIKTLKAEKSELREEKRLLKAEKEKMKSQLRSTSPIASGFIPPHPTVYHHPEMSKVPLVPSYGVYPMWHYLPPTTRDTSHDHELRPPAA